MKSRGYAVDGGLVTIRDGWRACSTILVYDVLLELLSTQQVPPYLSAQVPGNNRSGPRLALLGTACPTQCRSSYGALSARGHLHPAGRGEEALAQLWSPQFTCKVPIAPRRARRICKLCHPILAVLPFLRFAILRSTCPPNGSFRGLLGWRVSESALRPHPGRGHRLDVDPPRARRPDAARANVAGVAASGAGIAAGIWARTAWLVGASPGGARER